MDYLIVGNLGKLPMVFSMTNDNTLFNLSRRQFVEISGKAAAAAALTSVAFPSISLAADPTGIPVKVGHIGLGVRGGRLIQYTASIPAAKVVAVCDVYKPHLQKGQFNAHPKVLTNWVEAARLLMACPTEVQASGASHIKPQTRAAVGLI